MKTPESSLFSRHVLDATGSPEGLVQALEECLNVFKPQGLLILAADGNGFTPEVLDPVLRGIPVPVAGGIFPAIICGKALLMKGTLVIPLPCRPRVQVLSDLSLQVEDFESFLDGSLVGDHGRTMFVFVDGLAVEVGPLLSALFSVYGLDVNYLGGGAGSLNFRSIPCLMTNEGLIRDAAVMMVLDLGSGVGISHGMQLVSGPHTLSEVSGTKIKSLDWKPASVRYQELVHTFNSKLDKSDTFLVSAEFCLAVSRLGGEMVIRDPIKVDPDGAMYVTTMGLNEGGSVYLMRATPEPTISAAARALELARLAYRGAQPYGDVFCFDCFGRWQFLRDRYAEELLVLQDGRCELIGALTMGGEIANCGRDFLDYYNRTCVVGFLEGEDRGDT